MSAHEDRCRLVLIAAETGDPGELAAALSDALSGGDVASVILPQRGLDETAFQKLCAAAVPVIQEAGAAALVAGDSRIAGRVKADGLFVTGGGAREMADARAKFAPKLIVGGGAAHDRHSALALGETEPDFVFFGGLDGDIRPEPHRKNIALAEWWASMIDIPGILMGGSDAGHALAMAETGIEFIAFGKAVFSAGVKPGEIVARINAVLDEKAPRFDQ
jgi:Thiamine monophosphate synthase